MWRVEALGCALAGTASGVAIVVGTLLRKHHKATSRIRAQAFSRDGWLGKTAAHAVRHGMSDAQGRMTPNRQGDSDDTEPFDRDLQTIGILWPGR